MTMPKPTAPPEAGQDASRFSLMLGGPLYQAWRRSRLSGNALELLHRRTLVLVALTWLPLLVLSAAAGDALGDKGDASFLRDLEMQVRLLLALPLLLAAEPIVHRWTQSAIAQFRTHALVPEEGQGRFAAALASAMRLRDSTGWEMFLVWLVYAVGAGYLWKFHVQPDVASWYGTGSGADYSLTRAGWWAVLVSLPIFQFLSVRWLFRIFIWCRLLYQISAMNLLYMPSHPDRCGGIGFLSTISQGFSPIMLAQSVLLSGVIGERVLFQGARLPEFMLEIVGIVVLMMLVMLGPLLFFLPGMARARLQAQHQYSALAQRYAREFSAKWLTGPVPDEPLLGHADMQTLADIGSSFEVVEGMRWTPITWRSLVQLTGITLLPLAPLMLTMFPLDELLRRLFGALF